MQALQTHQPSAALQASVRAYAQRTIEAGNQIFTQLSPARLEPVLEFQFQAAYQVHHSDGRAHAAPESVIVGGYPHYARLEFPKGTESFGVFFHPTGFSRLFGIRIRELFHRFHDASSVMGQQIETLRTRLAEQMSFEQRVRITDAFLCRQLNTPAPEESMWRIADYIFEKQGSLRMQDLAQMQGLGLRQFERTFYQQIGATPKHYARIARFQSALDAKAAAPLVPWLRIAHQFGYHDQMHMVRDFHEFAGCAPGEALAQISHARPASHLVG